MNRTICISALMIFMMISFTSVAAQAGFAEAQALFLLIPMDIRSRALGEAGVALPDIAYAVDINPALLTQTRGITAGYGQGGWLSANSKIHGAYVSVGPRSLGNTADLPMAFGVGYKLLRAEGPRYTDEFGNIISQSNTSDWVATASGALGLRHNLSVGASIKLIRSTRSDAGGLAGPVSIGATAWALDLGIYLSDVLPQLTYVHQSRWLKESTTWNRLLIPRSPGLSVGFSLQNVGPEFAYMEGANSDPLPRVASAGISYRMVDSDLIGLLFVSQIQQSLISLDDLFDGGEFSVQWGFEIGIARLFDFRFGRYDVGHSVRNTPTWGFGLGPERIRLEYCRIDDELEPLNDIDMIALSVRW